MGASEAELGRLYDQLARCNWWMRRLRRTRPGEDLAMRKRLRPGENELAGVEHLSGWLWERAQLGDAPAVLDLGAGFGETLFDWARRSETGSFVGLGLSGYQVGKARQEAERRGLAGRCRFVQQSFDVPLDQRFDTALAIETLFHAPDLERTLGVVSAELAPGGQLLLVEDMAPGPEAARSAPARELCERWSTRRLHTREDYLAAIAASGLELVEEHHLSGLLQLEDGAARQGRRKRLSRLRRLLPFWRPMVDAFLGGLAMEELHAAGQLEYRTMRLTKPAAPAQSV